MHKNVIPTIFPVLHLAKMIPPINHLYFMHYFISNGVIIEYLLNIQTVDPPGKSDLTQPGNGIYNIQIYICKL